MIFYLFSFKTTPGPHVGLIIMDSKLLEEQVGVIIMDSKLLEE